MSSRVRMIGLNTITPRVLDGMFTLNDIRLMGTVGPWVGSPRWTTFGRGTGKTFGRRGPDWSVPLVPMNGWSEFRRRSVRVVSSEFYMQKNQYSFPLWVISFKFLFFSYIIFVSFCCFALFFDSKTKGLCIGPTKSTGPKNFSSGRNFEDRYQLVYPQLPQLFFFYRFCITDSIPCSSSVYFSRPFWHSVPTLAKVPKTSVSVHPRHSDVVCSWLVDRTKRLPVVKYWLFRTSDVWGAIARLVLLECSTD